MPDRERIAKIAGLLWSASEGEVLAAARAIRRAFEVEGKSVHDFMEMIVIAENHQVPMIVGMCDKILSRQSDFSPDAVKFVEKVKWMSMAFGAYEMTERQLRWFEYLYGESVREQC